jgi:hypothetical protein
MRAPEDRQAEYAKLSKGNDDERQPAQAVIPEEHGEGSLKRCGTMRRRPVCRSSPQHHMKISLNSNGLVCGLYLPMPVGFPAGQQMDVMPTIPIASVGTMRFC